MKDDEKQKIQYFLEHIQILKFLDAGLCTQCQASEVQINRFDPLFAVSSWSSFVKSCMAMYIHVSVFLRCLPRMYMFIIRNFLVFPRLRHKFIVYFVDMVEQHYKLCCPTFTHVLCHINLCIIFVWMRSLYYPPSGAIYQQVFHFQLDKDTYAWPFCANLYQLHFTNSQISSSYFCHIREYVKDAQSDLSYVMPITQDGYKTGFKS